MLNRSEKKVLAFFTGKTYTFCVQINAKTITVYCYIIFKNVKETKSDLYRSKYIDFVFCNL